MRIENDCDINNLRCVDWYFLIHNDIKHNFTVSPYRFSNRTFNYAKMKFTDYIKQTLNDYK